jgi:hypothetical protein
LFLRPTTHAKHKTTGGGFVFVFSIVPVPYNSRRAQKNTNKGVFSCLALFLHPAEHEMTPHWCLFVFGIVPSPLNICRAQNYTNNGVF